MAVVLQILKNGITWKVERMCSVICSRRMFESGSPSTPEEQDFKPISPRPSLPIITSRTLKHPSKYIAPRQAWVENLDTVQGEKLGMVDLHPEVFASFPRVDILFHNLRWQRLYGKVVYKSERTRAEMPGGGRKPWPQKGTGRARHGSIRSPIWKKGGKAHGVRGPATFFYMLPYPIRVQGLISALTCKFAQNDMKIVDSFEIPKADQKFVEDLVEERGWGLSVLFVNDIDVMPKNITLAIDNVPYFTLMPYYGLNVYSLLKYDTVVMTLDALNKIEERLLFNLHRSDVNDRNQKFHEKAINVSVLRNSSL